MALANLKYAVLLVVALSAGFVLFSLYKPAGVHAPAVVEPRGVNPSQLETVLMSITNTLTDLNLAQQAEQQQHAKPIQVQLAGAKDLAQRVKSISGLINQISVSHQAFANNKNAALKPLEQQQQQQAVASTTTTSEPTSTFPFRQILSLSNDRCLDAGTYVKLDGVKMYGCNHGLPQGFWVTAEGMIRHGSGHCLQSRDGEQAVRFVVCNPSDKTQLWELLRATEAMRYGTPFRNVKTQMCLDHQFDSIIAIECADTCSQLWMANHIQGQAHGNTNTSAVVMRGSPPIETKELLLCWVLFEPDALGTLGVAVNNTWGRDCDTLVFFSTEAYAGLNVIVLASGPNIPLWERVQQAWMHIYKHYYNVADWFFKIDDDSYVVVPYLREFVAHQDPSRLAHYGRRLHYSGLDGPDNLYVSGGSGLLMSRTTLGKLGTTVEKNPGFWAGPTTGPADLLMSRTLNKLGALPEDTRDSDGRHTFIALGLDTEYAAFKSKQPDLWLWRYSPDAREGPNCCSKRWICAHYFKPAQMYSLHKIQQLGCTTSAKAYPFLDVPRGRDL